MNNDQLTGAGILIGSIVGLAAYFWLVFISTWSLLTVQLTAFAAIAAVLLIVAWIGYTLATTPPPTPLENLNFDEDSDDEAD